MKAPFVPFTYTLKAGSIVDVYGLPYKLVTDVEVIGGSIPPRYDTDEELVDDEE